MLTVHNALLIGLGALQVLDAITTLQAFSLGAREGNKVMARIFASIPAPIALLVLKSAVLPLVIHFEVPDRWLGALVAYYVAILINNLRVIRKQRELRKGEP